MKIGLEIALIGVYLTGLFFDVCLAFKGRNRSNVATICDQSCLNLIGIDSRTQGDHEELKNLLQNCLVSSRFNQELRYKEVEHRFTKEIPAKIANRSI